MARVLYLSYDGLTDPLGQSQILPYLEGLSKRGHHIALISCEKPENLPRGEAAVRKICDRAGIEWHPLPYTKHPPVASTLADLKRMKAKAEELHARTPFDFLHCRSYLPVLIAQGFHRKKGVPYIFDMRGFWADERVEGHIWDLNNPVHKRVYHFFKSREPAFLNEAAAVVSLTHAAKTDLAQRYLDAPEYGGGELRYNYDRSLAMESKITVIPCAADTELFDPGRISDSKREWYAAKFGLETDGEYLGYVGSLGTWYLGEDMVRLYATLLRRRPQLRFLMVSRDNPEPWLRYAQKHKVPRANLIHVSAERREVPVLTAFMRAAVFFIIPNFSKMASSPTKQGELMAMGVPAICNAGVGDTAEIVERYGAGWVAKGFTDAEFEEIADNWEAITSLDRTHIRNGALDYFSLNKGVQRYAEIYESLERQSREGA